MCRITEMVKRTAKQQQVVSAATDFGVSAMALARLVKGGIGMTPVEKRAVQAAVPSKKLKELRRIIG